MAWPPPGFGSDPPRRDPTLSLGFGRTAVNVSNVPALSGFPFLCADIVLNPLMPAGIGAMSFPTTITIE